MVHKCVVGGCPNSSDTIIHYILPEEPKRRSLWLQFIERSKDDGETVSASSRVCGDHFSQDNFTQLDLGFTTRFILNVDAIPTIFPGDRASKDGYGEQAAADGNETDKTCNITISGTVSLACVKEEPFEYEVCPSAKTGDDINLELATHIKQEDKCVLSKDGREELRIIQVEDIKLEIGHSNLENESRDNRLFSCSTCGQKFRNKGILKEHESNHLEERSVKTYRCCHCGKAFVFKAFLKAHLKIHVKAVPTVMHQCTLCPRRFWHKSSRSAHMRRHKCQVTYKCPICEEGFQFKGAFSQHAKTAHAGCKLLCSFCDSSFVLANAFCKHIDKHVVVTPYYCTTCKIYQVTERGYLCHMRIHEQKLLRGRRCKKGSRVETQESAQRNSPEASGTHSALASLTGPGEEPSKEHLETEKGFDLKGELMVSTESEVKSQETGANPT